MINTLEKLTGKDYSSNQEIKWCPGCGDYSILKQTQTVLAEIEIPNHDIVFISGIGCSSRFPYYMNTYGMHSIHGRAPGIVSGLKATRPELSVWVVTGDGDALSIGGNHLMHLLRRNFDVNVLLFNNEIYGLTKGQYSPTSPLGKVTKSSPLGALDHPVNPLAYALGSNGTYIARTMDRDPKHLRETLVSANKHQGTSLVEIYQNCNVFNDGVFFSFTEKDSKPANALFLIDGKPLIFGSNNDFGVIWNNGHPKTVNMEKENISVNDLWIHDVSDIVKANTLSRFNENVHKGSLPRPFGVFYSHQTSTYENNFITQNNTVKDENVNLDELLLGNNYWEIK